MQRGGSKAHPKNPVEKTSLRNLRVVRIFIRNPIEGLYGLLESLLSLTSVESCCC